MKLNLVAEVAWVVRVRPPWEEAVVRGHQSDEKDPGAQRTSLRSRETEQSPGKGQELGWWWRGGRGRR